jgi:hypothetical protein
MARTGIFQRPSKSQRLVAFLAGAIWLAACGGSVGPAGSVPLNDAAATIDSGGLSGDAVPGVDAISKETSAARPVDGGPGVDATFGETGTPDTSSDSGLYDATPSGADVYITATVGAGASPGNGAAACQYSTQQQFVIIGTPTAPKPTTVADRATQGGALVFVTCTVSPFAGGFHVQASATVQGLTGGRLTIAGDVDTSGGQGLSGSFDNVSDGTFSSAGGCTVSYTGLDPPPVMPAVAAGRIWGHISCPFATKSDQLVDNPDGSATKIPRTCDAEADFLFENCGQ